MIEIMDEFTIIEFKNGPFLNDAPSCIGLVMEMLNMSKSFRSIILKGKAPGRKMEKTGRIRIGIQKFVNKDGVTPVIVDKLINTIRRGKLTTVKVRVGEEDVVELHPDNDVPGIIAGLMVRKVI